MLGPILLSIHNLTYYQRLVTDARAAIVSGGFSQWVRGKLQGWGADVDESASTRV
jgi:queuine tRNA-ribosyltransferase